VVLVAEEAAVAIQNARRLDAARAMATVDALTGLANYRHVTERLSSELSRARRTGRPLTIVMTDINDFKAINDTHGHLIGNKALNAVADILRSAGRASDVVGRYGGDEFLLVLPDTDLASAQSVWARIVERAAALQIPLSKGASLSVSLSGGAASYPQDGTTTRELIDHADSAMYAQKRDGKSTGTWG